MKPDIASTQCFDRQLGAIVKQLIAAGITGPTAITVELNLRGLRTFRGARWHPVTVSNLLKRIPKDE